MEELKTTPADEFFLGDPIKRTLFSPRMVQSLTYIVLSITTGIIGWAIYLPVVILIPVIWSKAPTKKNAWLVGLLYHLAASKGLIFGIPVFFSSTIFYGIVLWLIAGLIQSLPYFLCTYVRNSYLAIVLLLIALILPPVGIVGWANPLTAAGMLFPGTGFMGLFLTLCLIGFLVWLYDRNKIFTGVLALSILIFPIIVGSNVKVSQQIKGSTTNFAGNPSNIGDKFERDYQKFIKTYNQYSDAEFKTLVLPESTAGIWFDSTKHLWSRWQRQLDQDQSIVLPTLLPENKISMKTYNTLIKMEQENFTVLYKSRQSVPMAMWRPWAIDNVQNNWFDNPVFEIN
ncbi:MAG: hypothetical protein GY699_23625, partial [Desulfobacteraceae bacterium]|nr:hypothetical protein [Desulfobacteraceae bacterium]